MARAVKRLREKFDQPPRIEATSRELGMSVSTFHAHFQGDDGDVPSSSRSNDGFYPLGGTEKPAYFAGFFMR
jgi:AraC-like DNA-binding protein